MSIKLKQLPLSERPYEKLEMYGESTLSNSELLAIIIKTGTKEETALQLAQKVLMLNNENNNLRFLSEISMKELTKIKGIGKVKAIQLKAVCEIAKRMGRPINNKKIVIKTPLDVANLLMEELKYEKREKLKVIMLNTKNEIQKIIDVGLGGTSFINIQVKDILKEAIKMEIPRIIMVHNHPSGNATPSQTDIKFTKEVELSAKLLGLQLLDHIVIGDGTYESILAKHKS
ncbi:MAG: DNA repair protein RadC [Clostridia bacterium]|nr:DNA repair protein RadC [Clostridia bacterium]